MIYLKKTIAAVLILSLLGLCFPKVSLARQGQVFALAAATRITEHAPEFLAPQEEKIPVEEVKSYKWWWITGGVLAAAGIAAAAGGGGGGGGSSAPETGNVTVGW